MEQEKHISRLLENWTVLRWNNLIINYDFSIKSILDWSLMSRRKLKDYGENEFRFGGEEKGFPGRIKKQHNFSSKLLGSDLGMEEEKAEQRTMGECCMWIKERSYLAVDRNWLQSILGSLRHKSAKKKGFTSFKTVTSAAAPSPTFQLYQNPW